MAAKRLVSASRVAEYEKQLRAAVAEALELQVAQLNRTMRSHGLHVTLTAASGKKKAAAGAALGAIVIPHLWNQQSWTQLVDQYVAPAAREVAFAAVAAAGASFPAAALWGMTHQADTTAAAIVSRAEASGTAIGTRIDAAAVADDDVAMGVQTVLDTSGDILGNIVGAMGQAAANMGSNDLANALIAYNAPVYLSATKQWNNQGDDKVRPSHEDVDDVQVNELFAVGSDGLTGPGDPSGSDEETIGCRCWLTYDGLVPEGADIEDEQNPLG